MSAAVLEELRPLEGGGSAPVADVLQQLDRLLASQYFRNSRRYPRLLQFVVEETLAGHSAELKERTIGVAVFGRPADYDSNADPIVRVTAGEVRRRIAQYYGEPGREGELRIELGLGSYIAHFHAPHEPGGSYAAVAAHPPDGIVAAVAPPVEEEASAPLSLEAAEDLAAAEAGAGRIGTTAISAPAVPIAAATVAAASATPPLAAVPPASSAAVPAEAAISAVASSPVANAESTSTQRSLRWRRWALLTLTAIALVLLAAYVGYRWPHASPVPPEAATAFWQPMLGGAAPMQVVIGVHTLDNKGQDLTPVIGAGEGPTHTDMLTAMLRVNMVPLGDIRALNQLTDLLTRSHQPYRLASSTEASLQDLRGAPVLLLGGLDNAWTLRLTAPLRYHFYAPTKAASAIVDAENPTHAWKFDNLQSVKGASEDYGLVASYYDASIGQPVVLVAGIGMTGTLAAAEFVTRSSDLNAAMAAAGKHRNVEFLIGTEILNDEPGPPHVIASAAW